MKRRISWDFTWEEMTYSRVAVENGLRNIPPVEAEIAMKHLVKRLLQPLRIAYAYSVGGLLRKIIHLWPLFVYLLFRIKTLILRVKYV